MVKTTGGLVAVVGASLLAGVRREVTRSTAVLGGGAAVWLGLVDAWFRMRRRISTTYLLDLLTEVPLVAGWAAFALGQCFQPRPRG